MLFKIILFLSHGCFAKTKRNLKWGGGWKKQEDPTRTNVADMHVHGLFLCSWGRTSQQRGYNVNLSSLVGILRFLKIWVRTRE